MRVRVEVGMGMRGGIADFREIVFLAKIFHLINCQDDFHFLIIFNKYLYRRFSFLFSSFIMEKGPYDVRLVLTYLNCL